MQAIIKQIQETLEHGRHVDIKTGPLAAQVLKEIQKKSSESNLGLKKERIS